MEDYSLKEKKWLREASMNRLSLLFKNKTELIGSAAHLVIADLSPSDLDKSEMSSSEIEHLRRWITGLESGRQCMLAILDNRIKSSTEIEQEFQPAELIRSSINLPKNFLCDSGYLYERIFQRPPTSVIREALKMLTDKAFEKSSSSLSADQINIAIKQMKLDIFICNKDDVHSQQPPAVGTNDEGDTAIQYNPSFLNQENKKFCLQIMVELIRIHIGNAREENGAAVLLHALNNGSSRSSKLFKRNRNNSEISKSSANIDNAKIDLSSIEKYLNIPLQSVLEATETLSCEELEESNNLLKPYLKQLAALKANLTAQLKELLDSRAYLALGIRAEASDEAIKKAYKAMAIKLHPDKPGGDTAKFQQLQHFYHELLKRRKSSKAENHAINEFKDMRKKNMNASFMKSTTAGAGTDNKNDSKGSIAKETKTKSKQAGNNSNNVDPDNNNNNYDEDNKENIVVGENSSENESVSAAVGGYKKNKSNKDEEVKTEEKASNNKENTDESNDDDDEPDEVSSSESLDEGLSNKKKKNNNNDFDQEGSKTQQKIDEEAKKFMSIFSLEPELFNSSSNVDNNGDDDAKRNYFYTSTLKDAYESDSEHAQTIALEIDTMLYVIKSAASEITDLAQRNIQLHKNIENAGKMLFPYAIDTVYQLIVKNAEYVSPLSEFGRKYLQNATIQEEFNIDSCSMQIAVKPVEMICELGQRIAFLAMQIPSQCGIHYATSASHNQLFLNSIENGMTNSLNALKTVVNLINSHEQLVSCICRLKNSISMAYENLDIHNLLFEMIETSVKSNVITIGDTVDKVVEAALAIAQVSKAVHTIIKDTEANIKAEAKRKVAMQQKAEEMEDEYSAEDLEALQKSKLERQEEQVKQQKEAREEAKEKEDNNKKKAKTEKNEGKEEDPLEKGMNDLANLKSKIRLLQVQLNAQHIQTLQTMNTEALKLQRQIVEELKSLPFVSSFKTLFNSKSSITAAEINKQSQQMEKKLNDIDENSDDDEALLSVAANNINGTTKPKDFNSSLFSLLADMLDSSCVAFRNEFVGCIESLQSHSNIDANMNTISINLGKKYLKSHFDWLRIALAEGQAKNLYKNMINASIQKFYKLLLINKSDATVVASNKNKNKTSGSEVEDSDNNSNSNKTENIVVEIVNENDVLIALAPDYKTKTLYFASLVDSEAVVEIITGEVQQRIDEIFIDWHKLASEKIKEINELNEIKKKYLTTSPVMPKNEKPDHNDLLSPNNNNSFLYAKYCGDDDDHVNYYIDYSIMNKHKFTNNRLNPNLRSTYLYQSTTSHHDNNEEDNVDDIDIDDNDAYDFTSSNNNKKYFTSAIQTVKDDNDNVNENEYDDELDKEA